VGTRDAGQIGVVAALVRSTFLVNAVYAEAARERGLTPQQGQLLCVLMAQPYGMTELASIARTHTVSVMLFADTARRPVTRTLVPVVAPKVFVSYVHESERHQADVLALATFLRGQGVDAVLDRWSAASRHDWYAWAINEMTEAAFVIVVASPTYRAVGDGGGPSDLHRGVQSEATLLRDLVYGDRLVWTPKVLPVLLPGHGLAEIPRFLSPHTTSRYQVTEYTTAGAEELLRVIHGRPGHVAPPIQSPPDLPPRDLPDIVWCAEMPKETGFRPGQVEVHLVPGRDVGTSDPVSWATKDGVGLAVLETGQRSAWFAPTGNLAAELREVLTRQLDIEGPRPDYWQPAAANGETRVEANRWSGDEPAELAANLAELLAERPPAETGRISNVVTGTVHGPVIQSGDIHGGVHF
jgi:hypothetical protein